VARPANADRPAGGIRRNDPEAEGLARRINEEHDSWNER